MKQILPALFTVGALMVVTGASVYVTGWPAAPYVYTVGATLVALAQINDRPRVQNPAIRRLRFQQILGALLLVLAGTLMLLTRHNEWIVCLTIATIFELYTSIRLPQEEEKELKEVFFYLEMFMELMKIFLYGI